MLIILKFMPPTPELFTGIGTTCRDIFALIVWAWQYPLRITSANYSLIPISVWNSCPQVVIGFSEHILNKNIAIKDYNHIIERIFDGQPRSLVVYTKPIRFMTRFSTKKRKQFQYLNLRSITFGLWRFKPTLTESRNWVALKELAPNLTNVRNPYQISDIEGLTRLLRLEIGLPNVLLSAAPNTEQLQGPGCISAEFAEILRNLDYLALTTEKHTYESEITHPQNTSIYYSTLITLLNFILEHALGPRSRLRAMCITNLPLWLTTSSVNFEMCDCRRLEKFIVRSDTLTQFARSLDIKLPQRTPNLRTWGCSDINYLCGYKTLLFESLDHLISVTLNPKYFLRGGLTIADRDRITNRIRFLKQLSFSSGLSNMSVLNYGKKLHICESGVSVSGELKLSIICSALVDIISSGIDIKTYTLRIGRSFVAKRAFLNYYTLAWKKFQMQLRFKRFENATSHWKSDIWETQDPSMESSWYSKAQILAEKGPYFGCSN